MFIALLVDNNGEELTVEYQSFEAAWNWLWKKSDNMKNIAYAGVLEKGLWNDGHYIHQDKEIATMRIVR